MKLLHRQPLPRASASSAHVPVAPPARVGRSIALAFGSVLCLLVAYEVVEARWLRTLGPERVHSYQHVAGLLAVLLAAIISARLVLRESPSLFGRGVVESEAQLPETAESPTASAARDLRYAQWFILMRWIAILVAMLLVFVAVAVMDYLPLALWLPLGAAIGALVVLNLLYTFHLRNGVATRLLLRAQAYGDLVVLAVLLHFSGGIENPLTTVMVFHVIIAGIILERRQCYYVATAATLLFAAVALGELSHAVAHYTLAVVPHSEGPGALTHAAEDAPYVLARILLHGGVLFLTAYFATSVVGELRRGELEQRRMQARAVRADRLAAIGELAGRVAHEVNNPVAIINAKARLLLSDHTDELTPHTVAELEKIADLGDRIARIAQGLLAYCRPSLGQSRPTPVGMMARKALAIVESTARGAGVAIEVRTPDWLPPVYVNGAEIEQVFMNLFRNALDAMPGGGVLSVDAEVDASADNAAGRYVRISVADTGTGIAPALRDRIFEPFLTTKAEGKGTGLGLSICLGLIRGNGGTIDIESTVGRGTCVVLRLPVAGTSPGLESGALGVADRALRPAGVA